MYKSVQKDLQGQLPKKPDGMARAHLLLRQHGKEICRNNNPLCHSCPVAELCAYPGKRLKVFLRP
jgi:endonuclease III